MRRPGVLDIISVVSFALSILNVLWLVAVAVLLAAAGAASWLGGPVVGVLGTAIGLFLAIFLILQSILSIMLFNAATATWRGDPAGRSRHKLWAWLTIILDVIDLIFTWGLDPGAWFRLGYALFVLFAMNRGDVAAYFDSGGSAAAKLG